MWVFIGMDIFHVFSKVPFPHKVLLTVVTNIWTHFLVDFLYMSGEVARIAKVLLTVRTCFVVVLRPWQLSDQKRRCWLFGQGFVICLAVAGNQGLHWLALD